MKELCILDKYFAKYKAVLVYLIGFVFLKYPLEKSNTC